MKHVEYYPKITLVITKKQFEKACEFIKEHPSRLAILALNRLPVAYRNRSFFEKIDELIREGTPKLSTIEYVAATLAVLSAPLDTPIIPWIVESNYIQVDEQTWLVDILIHYFHYRHNEEQFEKWFEEIRAIKKPQKRAVSKSENG